MGQDTKEKGFEVVGVIPPDKVILHKNGDIGGVDVKNSSPDMYKEVLKGGAVGLDVVPQFDAQGRLIAATVLGKHSDTPPMQGGHGSID